jgi:DNA invertase Pin-like site-specific DNA recombinase
MVSPEVQREAVRRLAARHGDELLDEHILDDLDRSGRLGPDKRPGYAKLLRAIDSGACSAVYSYSLSRLGRSLPELSRLIKVCGERGIPVRLEVDQLDTSTASGRLLANILASIADFEADLAAERALATYEYKREHGIPVRTVRLYGEVRQIKSGPDEGALRGEDEDLEAVVAAWREAGSYSGAARLLNERGVKPRNSARGWWPSAVGVIIGRVDKDAVPRGSTRGAKAGPSDFILARLLRCPTCGTMLTGTRDRGGRRVRYSCRLGSVRPHPRVSVTEHLILPAIQAKVASFRRPTDPVAESVDEERRRSLEAQRRTVIEYGLAELLPADETRRRVAELEKELEHLEVAVELAEVPPIDWTWAPADLNRILRDLFEDIDLDPVTFQPVAFRSRIPDAWWAG